MRGWAIFMRGLILVGLPKSGKSTIAERVLDLLKGKGDKGGNDLQISRRYTVFSLSTPEIMNVELKRRTGFKIMIRKDGIIISEETMAMATYEKKGPRVGKYLVDTDSVGRASEILMNLVDIFLEHESGPLVIVIDELGKMEVLNKTFLRMMERLQGIAAPCFLLLTVGAKFGHPLKEYFMTSSDYEVVHVSPNNRDKLPLHVYSRISEFFQA